MLHTFEHQGPKETPAPRTGEHKVSPLIAAPRTTNLAEAAGAVLWRHSTVLGPPSGVQGAADVHGIILEHGQRRATIAWAKLQPRTGSGSVKRTQVKLRLTAMDTQPDN
eukprot:4787237-Amphidinium_carterae.1